MRNLIGLLYDDLWVGDKGNTICMWKKGLIY
ncbi:hypothetical protein DFQ07_2013 [Tenacibaculum caenipelagi]|uniref:Uncharacterized protein n=1 Tax=Tenacibaculum caenipelagi TaxID=1325435 RepID=A0A4R6TG05_9FLAO|nr:hypothetical protein DFQ07_2013 [Tenacibaculum caenipelagi]